MSGTSVALIESSLCEDLLIARFERPAGYEYRAGQWLRLSIDTPVGSEVRTFSHASAPADPYIEFATRVSDSTFKQALARMRQGDRATLSGPGGKLSLAEDPGRTVFLAGGVGITPIRGLLRDAVQRGVYFEDAVLLYGNRSAQCVAYRDELEAMDSHGLRTVLVYEAPDPEWAGEIGFITAETIERVIGTTEGRPFMVAGPPIMVNVMTALLEQIGVPAALTTIEAFGRAT